MAENENIAEFNSSVLGTQEYWNNSYERELKTYHEIGDVGEIWFGEEAQHRIVNWLVRSQCPQSDYILDIGCGNGMLLLALREEGFTNLMGIDYSESAIQLAKSISEKEGVSNITFQVCDLLSSADVKSLCENHLFDVCLDKGTYDAISLKDTSRTDDIDAYCFHVKSLLKKDGLLVITSCNWTLDQLQKQFHNDFTLVHEIPAPKFTFGGKTGQTVTTLVFKKKPET